MPRDRWVILPSSERDQKQIFQQREFYATNKSKFTDSQIMDALKRVFKAFITATLFPVTR
jgi:hypothetical protein